MKILYVILTCEKHLETRVKWQKESWLKNINESDYFYLDKPVGEEIYSNVLKKYVEFFKTFDRFEQYDWVFFCDDDTFVFTEKLFILLLSENNMSDVMIGHRLGGFIIEGTSILAEYCSGGAGIALNKNLILKVKEYMLNNNYPLTNESDTSLAIWCKLSAPDFTLKDKGHLFRPNNLSHSQNVNLKIYNSITYHYCEEHDFLKLKEHISI